MNLPSWAVLLRAPNPGPLTLDGTNTWVLRGAGSISCVVVDPGPLLEPHLRQIAGHGPVAAVLITHGHPDHDEGLPFLLELTGNPPVYRAGAGGPLSFAGMRLRVIDTPGHTVDSMCVLASSPDGESAVLTGDTVLGSGTAVVAWPDGSLGPYLASLTRLTELPPVPVLPGHGPVLADVTVAANAYLKHRRERLDQVREAVDKGARTASDVVRFVYSEVPEQLRTAAEWSAMAQLEYLREMGQA